MKILYIDDDHLLRDAVALGLRRDHQVLAYSTPASGEWLLNLESFDPDIVLCDRDMPGMNGLEVYAALPERFRKRFVMFTGGGDPSPSGMRIQKPVSIRDLRSRLDEFYEVTLFGDNLRRARAIAQSGAVAMPAYFELEDGIGALFPVSMGLKGFGPPTDIELCFVTVRDGKEVSEEIAEYRRAP